MNFARLLIALLFALFALVSARAHEVIPIIGAGNAVVVQLNYSNGQAFAFEAFEASPEGAKSPAVVGRTDAKGRAVFIPGEEKRWKLKAYSTDGHGVDLHFVASTTKDAPAIAHHESTRISLMLFGLSLILAAFGLYQLWIKKKKT